jgi:low affinity Fe/Cu permease
MGGWRRRRPPFSLRYTPIGKRADGAHSGLCTDLEHRVGRIFERFAQSVAGWAGRPPAFALAFLIIVVWGTSGPLFHWSDTWQLVINTGTTIVTFLMVFLIQNAQNRDAAAMQAKLDEVIRAIDEARNEFIGIEHLSEKQLLDIRNRLEHEFGAGDPARHETIEKVLLRR